MTDSNLISDMMRAVIDKILHGTDISEIAKEERPEVSMTVRIRMMVLLIVQAMNSENKTLRERLNNTRKELDSLKDDSLMALFDREQETRAKILAFFDCALETDVDILPLFNFTGYHWQTQGGQTLTYSDDDENLIDADDEFFDKTWSAHGYTLVRSFWQSTGSDVLMIFENKLEVT